MRKIFLKMIAPLSFAAMFSCTNNALEDENVRGVDGSGNNAASAALVAADRCASHKVHEEKLKENPGLQAKMDELEAYTQRFIRENSRKSSEGNTINTLSVNDDNATIEIPVIVNVIYNTNAQNISDDQINSQIEVLNRDFRATNTDLNRTLAFATLKSDLNYHFTLKPENIIRKYSSKTSWGTRDDMKSTKKGGINPTNPANNLNIWICNIGGGILGYAQFPGGSLSTDGVVVGPEYFGDKAYMRNPSTAYLAAPFDKGRTTTHEIGHWMNLRHIWGDATCGTDYVTDTPSHNTANYGCPSEGHKSTCTGTPVEMTMNYMDYTDDACMYMFSTGQKSRTRAVFASGGPRTGFYATVGL